MKLLEAYEVIMRMNLWDCYNDEPHEWTEKENEAHSLITKHLTPPTQEEVCKALGEWLKCVVEYKWKTFYKIDNLGRRFMLNIAILRKKPHLITLIGRFYEGLQ